MGGGTSCSQMQMVAWEFRGKDLQWKRRNFWFLLCCLEIKKNNGNFLLLLIAIFNSITWNVTPFCNAENTKKSEKSVSVCVCLCVCLCLSNKTNITQRHPWIVNCKTKILIQITSASLQKTWSSQVHVPISSVKLPGLCLSDSCFYCVSRPL